MCTFVCVYMYVMERGGGEMQNMCAGEDKKNEGVCVNEHVCEGESERKEERDSC